tara:strand:+ start:1549 stop:2259 length:711 start_codon:yes stop_codon:yes gene_type:complete
VIGISMKYQTTKSNCFWFLVFICNLVFSGVSMADPISELKVVGEAKLKVLFWDVYNSTLYSQSGEYQTEFFPQALKIDYLRDINADDLIEKTKEEWEKLGIKQETFSNWIPLLTEIFPNIKKGDTLLLNVTENQQSEFFFNGKTIGKITDKNFGPSFLRIWLDENSSYPKVRNKLIGLNLDSAVKPREIAAPTDALGYGEKVLITNKVTTNFSPTPITPLATTLSTSSTAESRLNK